MKTLVSINLGNFGSTGNIMKGICALAETYGYKTYCAYPARRKMAPVKQGDILILTPRWLNINEKLSFWTGLNGFFAFFSTLKFLRRLNKIKPDILHLHNLHNSYINLPLLFGYIKRHSIKVVWTLHDCWAFTGHCPYFTLEKCDKWKTGCGHCPQLEIYPPTKWDTTHFLWQRKRKWFTGVKDMTLVTPSKWLAELAKQSFLSSYPVSVIYNGLNLNVFQPTDSDFRQKYHIAVHEKIILGVAAAWGKRKGLDVFVYLAEKLGKDYKIVLVGTNDQLDASLPKNIITVHHTQNQREMAEIYTATDVFVNPTREEVFGLVNIEALACGTPVIVFNTGGCPEIVNNTCGSVVPCDDKEALLQEISRVCKNHPYRRADCIRRAKDFENKMLYQQYIELYRGSGKL